MAKKKKIGRPSIGATEQMTIHMTKAHKKKLLALARQLECSASGVFRIVLDGHIYL